MDNVDRYINLIKHNINLLDLLSGQLPGHLSEEDFSDWCVTIIFYILCIYMKAVCALMGEDVQDHYTLRQLINTKPELYNIAKFYRHIEEDSRNARYEGKTYNREYLLNRILPKFNTVRDCAINIIKKHGIVNIPAMDIKIFLDRI